MSKVEVLAAASVLGGGGLVTGSFYLPKLLRSVDEEIPFTSLDGFKNSGQKQGCVQDMFWKLSSTQAPNETASATDLDRDFFSTSKDGDRKKATKGCLVVNWDKKTHKNNKWSGNFRFLWAVRGENDRGVLVFLIGSTPKTGDNKEIKWEGVAYTLEKGGEEAQKRWTVKKKLEVPNGKAFKKGSKEGEENPKQFPRPSQVMEMGENTTFWGMFDKVDDLNNICSTDCGEPENTSSFRGYWDWSGTAKSWKHKEGHHDLDEWTLEMEKWWKETFEQDKFKLKRVANDQFGWWTNVRKGRLDSAEKKPTQ